MKNVQVVMLLVVFVRPAQLEESHFVDFSKNITSESQHESSIISKDIISNQTSDAILQEKETLSEVDDSKTKDVKDIVKPLSSKNDTIRQEDYRNITNFQEKSSANETDLEGSETRSNRGVAINKLLDKKVDFLERRSVIRNRNNSMLVIGIPVEAMTVLKSAADDHLGIIASSHNTQTGLEGSSKNRKFPLFNHNGFQGHYQGQNNFHKVNQGTVYEKSPKSQTRLHQKEVLLLSYEKPEDISNQIFKTVNIQSSREKKQLPPSNHNYEENIKYGIGQGSHISNFHDITNNYKDEKILVTHNSPSSEKSTFPVNYQEGLPYINSQIFGGVKTKKQFENYNQNNYENSGYPQETTAPIYQKPNMAINFGGDTNGYINHETVIPFLGARYKPLFSGAKHVYDLLKQLISTKLVPSKSIGSYPNFPLTVPNYLTIARPSLIPLGGNEGYYYKNNLPFTDLSGLGLGLRTLGAISSLGKLNKGIGLVSGIDLSKDFTISFSLGGGPKKYGFNKGLGKNIQIHKEHHDPFYLAYNTPSVYREVQSYNPGEEIGPLYSGSAVVEHIKPNIVKASKHSKQIHSSGQPVSQLSNNGFVSGHLIPQDSNRKYVKRQQAPQDYNKRFNVGQPFPQSDDERYSSDQPLFQDSNVRYDSSGKLASEGYNHQSALQELNKAHTGSQLISQSSNVEYSRNQPISQIANGRYTRGQTTLQGFIGGYPGDQLSRENHSSRYNNKQLPQGFNEGYNGGPSDSQIHSGRYIGGMQIPNGSHENFSGDPPVIQINNGGYSAPVPQVVNRGYSSGQNTPQGFGNSKHQFLQDFNVESNSNKLVSQGFTGGSIGRQRAIEGSNEGSSEYSKVHQVPQGYNGGYNGINNVPQDQNIWHSVSYQDPFGKPNFVQQNPNGGDTNLNTPQSVYHDNSGRAENKNIFAMKTIANRADLDSLLSYEVPNNGEEDSYGFPFLLLNESFKQYIQRIHNRDKPTRNIETANLAKDRVDEQGNTPKTKSEVNTTVKHSNLLTSNNPLLMFEKKKVFPKKSVYQNQQKDVPLNETQTPIATSRQKITNKTTNNKIVKRNFTENYFNLTSYDFKPEISSSLNRFTLATEDENVKFIGQKELQLSETKEDTVESLDYDSTSKAVRNNNRDISVLIIESNISDTKNKSLSQ